MSRLVLRKIPLIGYLRFPLHTPDIFTLLRSSSIRDNMAFSGTRWNHDSAPSRPIPALRKGTWKLPNPVDQAEGVRAEARGAEARKGEHMHSLEEEATEIKVTEIKEPSASLTASTEVSTEVSAEAPTEVPTEEGPSAEARGIAQGVLFTSGAAHVPPNWRSRTDLSPWRRQMFALREKYQGEKWRPNKKLSREEMEAVRHLKSTNPGMNASELAQIFKVSPEAIQRILKGKWRPNEKEAERLQQRWLRRGEKIRAGRRGNSESLGAIDAEGGDGSIERTSTRTTTTSTSKRTSTKIETKGPKNKHKIRAKAQPGNGTKKPKVKRQGTGLTFDLGNVPL